MVWVLPLIRISATAADRDGGGGGDLEVDADGALDVLLPTDRLLEDAADGRVRSRVVEGALARSGPVGGGHRSTGGGVLEPEETGKLDRELVAERHLGVASVVVDVEFEVVALPDLLAVGDGVSRLVHVFEDGIGEDDFGVDPRLRRGRPGDEEGGQRRDHDEDHGRDTPPRRARTFKTHFPSRVFKRRRVHKGSWRR